MANYKYEAWDAQGNRVAGLRKAVSEEDILHWLRGQNLTPVSLHAILTEAAKKEKPVRYKKVRSSDLANFSWQLSVMLSGGLSITLALETISIDMDNRYLGTVVTRITDGIREGKTFAETIREFPHVFNPLACSIILAGETGGSLPASLQRLATYYDNRDKFARKVRGAITYPIFVVGFIILVIVVMMTFIIPQFRKIFEGMGSSLPMFTKAFMGVYDAIVNNLFFGLLLIIGIVTGFYLYQRTQAGHGALSKLMLRLPFVGKILTQAFFAMFCRTLSTLLNSGVTILEAFGILSGMTNNEVMRTAIMSTRKRIIEGANVSSSMASSGFFHNVVIKMTQIGEESGSLPDVLDKTADYYERRVDSLVTTMLTLLEPILIISVGMIVLVTVLALYLPIFYISDIKG